jgi:hypothetical protein
MTKLMTGESAAIEPPFISSYTRRRVVPACEENEDGQGGEASADGEDRPATASGARGELLGGEVDR